MFIKLKQPVLISALTLMILIVALHWISAGEAASNRAAGAPRLWVTPLELDFGPVGVGMSSATQVVTITNLGSATLTDFAGGGVTAPFQASQNCAGGVAPGASCRYFFSFTPSAVGTFTTTSDSATNAGRFSVRLRGTGVGAGLQVNPLSLDFGSVYSGTTSATQIVTIRNTGLTTLTNFAGGGVGLPFQASQNCAGGVAPGASCRYSFRFAPTASGRPAATSNSSTNAGSFSIRLYGGEMISVFLPLVIRQ